MRAPAKLILTLVVLLAAFAAGTATAQSAPPGQSAPQRREGGRMSNAERQQLREDLRRQHANPGGEAREGRYAEWQRLSPEQRAGVRRQLRDANRNMDRRRH